jgi:hypothetical protein
MVKPDGLGGGNGEGHLTIEVQIFFKNEVRIGDRRYLADPTTADPLLPYVDFRHIYSSRHDKQGLPATFRERGG